MNWLESILAHDLGEIRCGVASTSSADLGSVLAKFGLRPDAEALVTLDRPQATALLARLFERDLAYDLPRVAPDAAAQLAAALVAAHAGPAGRYWSNGGPAAGAAWTPLTASTFDRGLLIDRGDGRWFCVWFEGED